MGKYITSFANVNIDVQNDILAIIETKQDGISTLFSYLKTQNDADFQKVVTKFQSMSVPYFKEKDLKSERDWGNTFSYLPHQVNSKIYPITQDQPLFSDFSLIATKPYSFRFPLLDSLSGTYDVFRTKTFPSYNYFIAQLENKGFSINSVGANYKYEFKNKASKYKKLFNFSKSQESKEESFYKDLYNEQLNIPEYYSGKNLSEQDKFALIINHFNQKIIENKPQNNKSLNFSDQEILIAQLCADILFVRGFDFGDSDSSSKLERCFNLQLCNVLNATTVNNETIKLVLEFAKDSALNMLTSLNIDLVSVQSKINKLGYIYISEPNNMFDALINYYNPLTMEELKKIAGQKYELEEDLKVPFNEKLIYKTTLSANYDKMVVALINRKRILINEKLKKAREEGKQKQIKLLTKKIDFLDHILGIYSVQSSSEYEPLAKIDNIANISDLENCITAKILEIKQNLLKKIFEESDKVVTDKKMESITLINKTLQSLYNKDSVSRYIEAIICDGLGNDLLKEIEISISK